MVKIDHRVRSMPYMESRTPRGSVISFIVKSEGVLVCGSVCAYICVGACMCVRRTHTLQHIITHAHYHTRTVCECISVCIFVYECVCICV